MSNFHKPVLLKEAIEFLNIQRDKWYIDCNLGGAGHTEEILKRGGKVIGIDLDREAIEEVAKKFNIELSETDDQLVGYSDSLILIQDNFADIDHLFSTIQQYNNPTIKINGVLFDLGFSSHQMNTASRGFSFGRDGTLDMRMDQTRGASAKDLVNGLYERELADIFTRYGEEPMARQIAKRIVSYRQTSPIESTNQLAKIVESVKRRRPQDKIHPATQVFQALRIAINNELRSLEIALPKAFEILSPGGRIVVISFHSLEDRIVKNFFKSKCHPELVSGSSNINAKILTLKPLQPSVEEISQNPRSRSAKMRVIEKLVN